MTVKASLFILLIIYVLPNFGSGAFIPASPNRSETYNHVKALVILGGEKSCKQCHITFDRNRLLHLTEPVIDLIGQCNKHQPCYSDDFNPQQRRAIQTYFKQRYRLP